jgi:hypothetical protein
MTKWKYWKENWSPVREAETVKSSKQAIEAREKSKQKEQERKDDTRRKILLGSYLIKKMNANEANKEKYSLNSTNI